MAPEVIEKFILDQLSVWPEAAQRYRALKTAEVKRIEVNGLTAVVQCNPHRIGSVTAEIDEESISARPCFLCRDNRPPEQRALKFEGRKGRKYEIVINRYPIFSKHLLIVLDAHERQSIWHHYVDMLDMARSLEDYVVYYNGPVSGASAPDHLHFQACPKGILPLQVDADRHFEADDLEYVASVQDAKLFRYGRFSRGVFALRAATPKSMAKMFYRLLDCAPVMEGETEPRFNVITYFTGGEYRAVVMCRRSLRSHHYFAEGEAHFTIGPGCAEMAGYFILPERRDFERIDASVLAEVLSEVSVSEKVENEIVWRLTRRQPKIEVGILSAEEIVFEIISDGAGPQKVTYQEGKINYNGSLYDELRFEAVTISTLFAEPSFILHDVVIGVDFHWERKMQQKFAGTLKFIVENGKVTAVNVIGVEDYLLSVIASEMKATATLEYLKAHSVISRSWVMSQLSAKRTSRGAVRFEAGDMPSLTTYLDAERHKGEAVEAQGAIPRRVEWFGHSDHKRFDVCADDHCQRYQGLTMAVGENVRRAIDETWGQVMMYGGELVDARFSKCCGGVMELYSTSWEDRDYPYLVGKPDTDPEGHVFCDTHDKAILSQVLNDYDLETEDFYRWRVEYSVEYASELFARRSGFDVGTLQALIPLETGPSGRIKLLRVRGSKGSVDIGKELIIRRYFSENHLKSSAFTATFADGKLIIDGAGWGHGVGLCQIGAAVMAYKGYTYEEILQHYYPGHELVRE